MTRIRTLNATQTSERLMASREEILRRWESTLRAKDTTFDQQAHTPLRDYLAEYLVELARSVAESEVRRTATASPSDESNTSEMAKAHGVERTSLPRYSLAAIFKEYRVLRAVIFAVLADAGEQPDEATRERIVRRIEDAMLEASEAFASVHLRRERLATRHRQQLLEIVSHDLRTPLQTILIAATLIRRLVDDERVTPHIHKIWSAARTAAKLTRDLVDIAQIESGGLSVNALATDVRSLIEEAIVRQREEAAAAAVGLEAQIPPDLTASVLADREGVLRVFDNVITNAIKATSASGTITVSARMEGTDVEFRVSDTGCGIPPADLDHVFDRFRRVEREGQSGAGLGLAITKGLLEAHGGRVWIESQPEHGTTVFFTLPTTEPTNDAVS